MTDEEIEFIQRESAERKRIKKMVDDLNESEKERKSWSKSQEHHAPSVNQAYAGGKTSKVKGTGNFDREQITYEGK
jgi:hypothetical protein